MIMFTVDMIVDFKCSAHSPVDDFTNSCDRVHIERPHTTIVFSYCGASRASILAQALITILLLVLGLKATLRLVILNFIQSHFNNDGLGSPTLVMH